MAERCSKCFQLKLTPDSKCACNFKAKSEVKKEENSPKPIPKISEKQKEKIKQRWRLDLFFAKIAKKHFDKNGKWKCKVCKKEFNINNVLNQSTCFAHILDRKDYPEFSVFENNIAVVCSSSCHKKLDSMTSWYRDIIKPEIQALRKINIHNLQKYIT